MTISNRHPSLLDFWLEIIVMPSMLCWPLSLRISLVRIIYFSISKLFYLLLLGGPSETVCYEVHGTMLPGPIFQIIVSLQVLAGMYVLLAGGILINFISKPVKLYNDFTGDEVHDRS